MKVKMWLHELFHFPLQGNDLQGVEAYFNVDLENLYTLGTTVIDYRGYRVTAQSIIPGLSFLCYTNVYHVPSSVECVFMNLMELSFHLL